MDLVLVPAHNEEETVGTIVQATLATWPVHVLVVDDGSTDATAQRAEASGARVLRLPQCSGYGGATIAGFAEAVRSGYEFVATLDADGQHEPEHLGELLEVIRQGWDVVSGTRYHPSSASHGLIPAERVRINREITDSINRFTGWSLTDAFCGMKAYRVAALARLTLDEVGYAFPLQFWIRAAHAGLRVTEVAIDNLYLDPTRSFGGTLDDPEVRLAFYASVLECEMSSTLPVRNP